ncbi:MAG: DUF4351 domain-containing protein, partial [Synechococcales bacterium]|nr:DUF4351 domain-containing protein [Synechococcales bacterium]
MRESVTCQAVLEEGREEGREEGWQAGRQEGRQEGERSLILRQLHRRVGTIPDRTLDRIQTLTLPQLELLGDALLDFSAIADLTTWLETHTAYIPQVGDKPDNESRVGFERDYGWRTTSGDSR